MPENGNKRKAEAELAKIRAEFEIPEEAGELSSDMLFADFLLEWLEIAKGRLAIATYSSYTSIIKNPLEPYFRKKKLTLRELEARHLQMFYSEMLKKVKSNTVIHYHAVIHSADEMQEMFEALRGTKLELPVLVAAFYMVFAVER